MGSNEQNRTDKLQFIGFIHWINRDIYDLMGKKRKERIAVVAVMRLCECARGIDCSVQRKRIIRCGTL